MSVGSIAAARSGDGEFAEVGAAQVGAGEVGGAQVGVGESAVVEQGVAEVDAAGVGFGETDADPFSRLTPARRRNLVEGAAYLDVAPTVVRVATDVPLPAFDPALPQEPLDPMALEELATRWGLGTSLTRLLDTLATSR